MKLKKIMKKIILIQIIEKIIIWNVNFVRANFFSTSNISTIFMVDNIISLIHGQKWKKITNLIKEGKLDINKSIITDNNIIHLAALNNIIPLIKYSLKKDKYSLIKSNNEGYTPLHIMAKYKNYNLLDICLKEDESLINTNDKNNNPVFFFIDFFDDFFKKI